MGHPRRHIQSRQPGLPHRHLDPSADGWTPEQSRPASTAATPLPESLRSFDRACAPWPPVRSLTKTGRCRPYALLHVTDNPPARLDTRWKRLSLLWLAVPLALATAPISAQGSRGDVLLLAVIVLQIAAWLFATHLQSRFLLPLAIPLSLLLGRGAQGLHLTEGLAVSTLRIASAVLVAIHALCAAFLLLPEAGLLGGVVGRDLQRSPAPFIGQPFARLINVQQMVEHPAAPASDERITAKVLLLGDATAWRFPGPVEYCTVFDRNPFLELLGSGNPDNAGKCLAWLHEHAIRYIWIDWSEVTRLRDLWLRRVAHPRSHRPAACAGESSIPAPAAEPSRNPRAFRTPVHPPSR